MISLLSLLNNISHSYMKLGDKLSNLPFQPKNGFPFKQITLLGMNIYYNARHSQNTPFPMLVTLSGMSMLVREQHCANA